jgi:hypothetical protein
MIAKNPLINKNDNLTVLQRVEQENNLTEITISRGMRDYIPVLLSLAVTLFGFWTFTDLITNTILYKALILLVIGGVILLLEHSRTDLLGDWFSTKLELKVNKDAKKPIVGFIMAIAMTSTFVAMDVMGAISFKTYLDTTAQEKKTQDSTAFKTAQADSEMKNLEFKEWLNDKKVAFAGCDKSYPVSKKPRGNSWCKKDWVRNNKKPSTGANLSDKFTAIKSSIADKLGNTSKYFFIAFLALSMIFNYLAVSSIFRQYRAKDKQLFGEMIEVLKDRFEKMKTAKIAKMRNSTQAMDDKVKEAYRIEVELEKSDYDLGIARTLEILNQRQKTVATVNAIGYEPKEQRSGFVGSDKSIFDNGSDLVESDNVEADNKTIDLSLFDDKEVYLIKLLWDNGNIKVHDGLIPRDRILEKIGVKKHNTVALTKLYKKLKEHGYIYRKISYFAKAELGGNA